MTSLGPRCISICILVALVAVLCILAWLFSDVINNIGDHIGNGGFSEHADTLKSKSPMWSFSEHADTPKSKLPMRSFSEHADTPKSKSPMRSFASCPEEREHLSTGNCACNMTSSECWDPMWNQSSMLALVDKLLGQQGKRRRVVFVGDSMSNQIFSAFTCRLFWSGLNLSLLRRESAEVLQKSSSYSTYVKNSCYATDNETLTVCNIGAGTAAFQPVFGWVALLLHNGDLRRGDVLILNEGLHFRRARIETSKWWSDAELARMEQALLNNQQVQALRDLGVHLFWVETTAQHHDTPSGTYNGIKSPRPCKPIRNLSFILQRNAAVNSILQKRGIRIIPALKPTIPAFSSHTQKLHKARTDCTHFCLRSTVLHRVIDLVVRAVLSTLDEARE